MKKLIYLTMIILAILTTACGGRNRTAADKNPLLEASGLPYEAPPFDKIKTEHFRPAIKAGMEQQREEIRKIAENPEQPTFENTFVELEKSGMILSRSRAVFEVFAGADSNREIQQIEEEIAEELAAHTDAIYLNDKLFTRVRFLYNKRSDLDLDAESRRLIEYYYDRFVRAGANLDETAKEVLKGLNKREAVLTAQFGNKLLNAAKAGALISDSEAELKGLSAEDMSVAAGKAAEAGADGRWMLSLSNTTQQAVFASLENRNTRAELFENSVSRCSKGDTNDTRRLILELAKIRAEKAALMGFPNYASWKLTDQMAKRTENVRDLLGHLLPLSVKAVLKEAGEIQAYMDKNKVGYRLAAHDWSFFAEKLRKAKYDLNEDEIRPYFVLDSVLKNGVFFTATELYGITFKERFDIPVYHPDVRVFELFEEDGTPFGLFYCDFFKRDSKSGGAWMSNMVEQSKLLGTKPVIYNVCNFTKPGEGKPALMSFDEVQTMFHEFGHALHGFFADQQYVSLSGTSVARDFVEFPSQINEHWALYPKVIKNYARHCETGAPMPDALIEKLKKAAGFNQGYALAENLAAVSLDMAWHMLSVEELPEDVDEFENAALKEAGINLSTVPPRYRTPYFRHIWSNGYAAGYYAYVWSEMLDADSYEWFVEHGGLNRENGERFRRMILSKGNTEDFETLYKAFRGRMPDVKPLLRNRGLSF